MLDVSSCKAKRAIPDLVGDVTGVSPRVSSSSVSSPDSIPRASQAVLDAKDGREFCADGLLIVGGGVQGQALRVTRHVKSCTQAPISTNAASTHRLGVHSAGGQAKDEIDTFGGRCNK